MWSGTNFTILGTHRFYMWGIRHFHENGVWTKENSLQYFMLKLLWRWAHPELFAGFSLFKLVSDDMNIFIMQRNLRHLFCFVNSLYIVIQILFLAAGWFCLPWHHVWCKEMCMFTCACICVCMCICVCVHAHLGKWKGP